MNLDYSSLHLPVTQQDIEAYRLRHNKAETKKGAYYSLAVWLLLIIGGLAVLMMLALSFMSSGFTGGSIVTLLTIFAVWVTMYSLDRSRKRLARLHRFAKQNNMKLILNHANPDFSGLIFDEGYARTLDSALLLSDGTIVGNYSCIVGSGKHRRTIRWKIACIKLPRRLPHMVLDAKANNFMSRFSNLPESFRGQALSLEGDFNKYFTLYAPKKYERDALYIFTPDVMATLIDAGKDYDMEIIDDNLYVYANGSIKLDSEVELRPLMESLDTIASRLRRRTDYYADERVGDRAANIVAEPGHRLKTNTTLVTIFFFIFFVIYVITYLMPMFMN